jgi:hypothetical protein
MAMPTGSERRGAMARAVRWRTALAGVPVLAVALTVVVTLARAAAPSSVHALSPEIVQALEASAYVYIATERRDGSLGAPAEIWFLFHQGAVWVASPPTTWRVKRIRARRPKAKIAVGKLGGPSFRATGTIVADRAIYDLMCETYARKYPDGWPRHEQTFREGLKDGTRVLIRYQPLD